MGVPLSTAGVQAPLLAFVPDDDVFPFESLGHFAQKSRWWAEQDRHLGIEIVDSAGQRWLVSGLGRPEAPRKRWWQFGAPAVPLPEVEVEAGGAEAFAVTRQRVDDQASRIFAEGDQALADIRAAAAMDELTAASLQITIRAQGLRILAGGHAIPVVPPARVAHRAIILLAFIRMALGASRRDAIEWLDEDFVSDALSSTEAQLLATRQWSDEQRQEVGWHAEALVALLWALDLTDMPQAGEALDLGAIADKVPPFAEAGCLDFVKSATLRPAVEIAARAEQYWEGLREADKADAGEASDDIVNIYMANELRATALTWIVNPDRIAWR